MENKHLDSHFFRVTTLSPVHVGSGRKYMRGLDFVYENGSLLFLNNDAIWKAFPAKLPVISKHMADGNINEVEKLYNTLNVLSNPKNILFKADFPFKISEVFQMIADGFNRPMIPGSSIKGSLRSIILNKLHSGNGGHPLNENALVGRIDDSLFKYLQVTDTKWKSRTVLPVKVFSGDLGQNGKANAGRWKDARVKGHVNSFHQELFSFGYEIVPEEEESYCRLNFPSAEKAYNISHSNITIKGLDFFRNFDLIQTIKDYMENYFNKEIAYFKSFANRYLLGDDGRHDLIEFYKYLKNENSQNCSFVLRLGAGSGYYSITGDWQHDNHLVTHYIPKDKREELIAKTRKLTFEQVDEDKFQFTPLGFLLFEEISRVEYEAKMARWEIREE